MLQSDSTGERVTRLIALVLVMALAAVGAAGQAAAQNEDAYRATIDAPNAVKVGEPFDVTLNVDIVDSPAQVSVDTTLTMRVDGEEAGVKTFGLDVENGKSVSKTFEVTLDEPGTHDIGFEIEGTLVGSQVVGGNPSSKPGLGSQVTAVSNVSTAVGDVEPGSPANVSLERSTADVQLAALEMGASEEIQDVFVEIQPSTSPPSGYSSGPEDAERYFVVRPTNADPSLFTTVRASVLVAEDAFLPGADVGVHRGTGDGWEELPSPGTEVEGGTVYNVTMDGLDPIAVTATGGEEPSTEEQTEGEDGAGADEEGGQGMPGFTAAVAVAALAVAAFAAGRRR